MRRSGLLNTCSLRHVRLPTLPQRRRRPLRLGRRSPLWAMPHPRATAAASWSCCRSWARFCAHHTVRADAAQPANTPTFWEPLESAPLSFPCNPPGDPTPPHPSRPPSPAAIAVRKDDLTLAQFLNGAMRELIAGGGASPLLKIEAEVGWEHWVGGCGNDWGCMHGDWVQLATAGADSIAGDYSSATTALRG